MPVYFVHTSQIHSDGDGGTLSITGKLFHHLSRVLRVSVGETLRLSDEHATCYTAAVARISSSLITLDITGKEAAPTDVPASIRLGIGLIDPDRMTWVLQKATELGVWRISPLYTTRSLPKPSPERLIKQHDRWMRIAAASAQQAQRRMPPIVDPPCNFSTFLTETASCNLKSLFFEEEAGRGASAIPQVSAGPEGGRPSVALLVGPVGGWAAEEVAAATASGYITLSLGETILRAETAAVAAVAIVQYVLRVRGGYD